MNFAKTGMKAYVELVQRREREIGCDVLTHQRVRATCPSFEISLISQLVEWCGLC